MTLFFGMWANNRVETYRHLKIAIDRLAAELGSHDPATWPTGSASRLANIFQQVLRASRVGNWGDAKARAAGRTSRTANFLRALARGPPRPTQRETADFEGKLDDVVDSEANGTPGCDRGELERRVNPCMGGSRNCIVEAHKLLAKAVVPWRLSPWRNARAMGSYYLALRRCQEALLECDWAAQTATRCG
jgi:hypothetical protein